MAPEPHAGYVAGAAGGHAAAQQWRAQAQAGECGVGQGTFSASSLIDASTSPVAVAREADLDNGTSRRFGGHFSFGIGLNGTGDSIAQVMEGLDGKVILRR